MLAGALVVLGVLATTPDPQHKKYLTALRRELLLSPLSEDANHSAATPGILTAKQRVGTQSLLLVVPPRHVYTVSEALGIVGYINKNSRSLPRTLPRHFVLAAFVLHQRYVAPRGSLVRLWLESLPPLDATCLWSDDELRLLDDRHATLRATSRREQLQEEYDSMMHVLLEEGGMRDDVTDVRGEVDWREAYAWAVGVVTRYAWHFSSDFPVIVPLSLRFHPAATADIAEWGDEEDPGAALYVAADRTVQPGDEISAWAEDASTSDLLLHGGYVWDDASSATVKLALTAGGGGARGAAAPPALEAKREAMLAAANWTREMEFELGTGALHEDMMAWLRLIFAAPNELELATSHVDFRLQDAGGVAGARGALAGLSRAERYETEAAAVRALLGTLDRELGAFEYSPEEDQLILEAHRRAERGQAAQTALLPRRAVIAVTYRRLVKRVLHRVRARAEGHLRSWTASRSASGPRAPADGRERVGIDPRGSASAAQATSAEAQPSEPPASPMPGKRKRKKKTTKKKKAAVAIEAS